MTLLRRPTHNKVPALDDDSKADWEAGKEEEAAVPAVVADSGVEEADASDGRTDEDEADPTDEPIERPADEPSLC